MTAQLGERRQPVVAARRRPRAPAGVVEESRETIAGRSARGPSEVVFTCGGTEADNLAVKGLYWAAPGADPRRRRGSSPARSSTTRCSTRCTGWPSTRAPQVEWLPVDGYGPGRPRRARGRPRGDPASVALVTVMWANNEVGTVQPVAELAAVARGVRRARSTPTRCRPSASCRSTSPRAALDAMTLTGAQDRRPARASAPWSLAARSDLTPLLHGGGQERDVRSGTLDAPAIAGFAAAAELRGDAPARSTPRRWPRLRDELVRRVREAVPDAVLNGDPDPAGPAARQRALLLPRLRGRRAADAARRAGDRVLDRARPAPPACAQPSHVLLAMGARRRAGPRLAAVLPRPHLDRGRRRRRSSRRIGPVVERARARRPGAVAGRPDAMQRPRRHVRRRRLRGGRGPRRRRRPRRDRRAPRAVAATRSRTAPAPAAAARSRTPATPAGPPTSSASRSTSGTSPSGSPRTSSRTSSPSTPRGARPNPCLRCNEKIKFAAVLDKALALGFDAVVHRPLRPARRRPAGRELHRAVDPAKDQSYVLGVLTADQLARAMFPLGGLDQGRGPRRGRAARPRRRRTSRTATTSASSPTATPPASCAGRLGCRARRRSSTPTARCSARTTARSRFTVGQRKGLRLGTPAADGRPRYVLDVAPVTGTVTVGPREAARRDPLVEGVPAALVRRRPPRPVECTAQVRAHGDAVPADGRVVRTGPLVARCRRAAVEGVAAGQAVVLYDGDPGRRLGHRRPRAPPSRTQRRRSTLTVPAPTLAGRQAARDRASGRCPAPTSREATAASCSASCPTCRTCPSCRPAGPAPTLIGRTVALLRRPARRAAAERLAARRPPGPRRAPRARRLLGEDLDAARGAARGLRRPAQGAGAPARGRWPRPLELRSGDAALADPGAVRDLAALARRGARGARRRRARAGCPGAPPARPARRAGAARGAGRAGCRRPSGFGTLARGRPERGRRARLRACSRRCPTTSVRSCTAAPPTRPSTLLRGPARRLSRSTCTCSPGAEDDLGEAVEAGTGCCSGSSGPRRRRRRRVPGRCRASDLDARSRRARSCGAGSASPPTGCLDVVAVTPTCGLAGASPGRPARRSAAAARRPAARRDPEGDVGATARTARLGRARRPRRRRAATRAPSSCRAGRRAPSATTSWTRRPSADAEYDALLRELRGARGRPTPSCARRTRRRSGSAARYSTDVHRRSSTSSGC